MAFWSSSATLANADDSPQAGGDSHCKSIAAFAALFVAIWLLLYATYEGLPFVRPGSEVVLNAKFEELATGRMFQPEHRQRLMFFGNSRLLSGFRPLEFDTTLGSATRSYNLGLPGELQFLPILETALNAGNVPTHVFLTIPWNDKTHSPGWGDLLRDDAAVSKALFPFKTLPRDAALFMYQSKFRFAEAARAIAAQRDAMLAQRGWYFIAAQSHYPGDRLPENYRLPTDRPALVERRNVPRLSLSREHLEGLAVRHGFQIIFIPGYYRTEEFAPSPTGDGTSPLVLSDAPLIRVTGPDYWLYPPTSFADPVHLNPTGASTYTAALAELLKARGILR
jgi:hypothetical protein